MITVTGPRTRVSGPGKPPLRHEPAGFPWRFLEGQDGEGLRTELAAGNTAAEAALLTSCPHWPPICLHCRRTLWHGRTGIIETGRKLF